MDCTLAIATEVARGHEDFKLPAKDVVENLVAGDFAKLCFLFETSIPGGPTGERMWVQVMGRHDGCGHYTGKLSNDPLYAPVKLGDEMPFGPEHVLSVMKKDEAVTGEEDIGWTPHERNDPDNWRKER